MYPPLPFPLPRVVPREGGVVDGHFLPGGVSGAASTNPCIFFASCVNPVIVSMLIIRVQTVVSTNPLAASMSAENFHDPWVFNPKRWMDADNQDILDASQPFSLGSRICLGQRYA